MFPACVEFDTRVEVNFNPVAAHPADELGCDFSIDTDAHASGRLDRLCNEVERANECGVEPDRVIDTRFADELLAWTEA